MIPQTDKSWRDYRALNQNWSCQPTLAGCAVSVSFTQTRVVILEKLFLRHNLLFLLPVASIVKSVQSVTEEIQMAWLN